MHPPLLPDLSERTLVPERMDDPNSNPHLLERTLAQFNTVNRWLTRSRHVLKHYVIRPMLQAPGKTYHLVDLGAGACETPAWLLKTAHAHGLSLTITACDHDPRVVRFAKTQYGHLSGLHICRRDIMNLANLQPIDFVFANHLLHHLTNEQITALLRCLATIDHAQIVLNDLRRCRSAYLAYYIVAAVLFRKSFARTDGLLSVRKGFTIPELEHLCRKSGGHFHTHTLFPARLLVTRSPHGLPSAETS